MTLEVRPSNLDEVGILKKWLDDPTILRWFPMLDAREIEDAVRIWMNYARLGAAFTAALEGISVGMGVLYIQPYKKFSHQCLFAIVVDKNYRNRGIGKTLIETMMEQAKQKFGIEILHLEVYEGNPAFRLYERLGFKEYGRHPRFIKAEDGYADKIMMQKELQNGRS